MSVQNVFAVKRQGKTGRQKKTLTYCYHFHSSICQTLISSNLAGQIQILPSAFTGDF